MKHILLALVAVLAATDAAADPMADLIGSKTYWQLMDWENAERSEIWKMSGWRPYAGKQDPGRTIVKERPVDIDTKTFNADLRVEERPMQRNALVISSIELSDKECEQIADWLGRHYGPPKLVVDSGYKFDLISKGNTVENIERTSQWDIGSTRVTFSCAGLKTDSADGLRKTATLASILAFGSTTIEREIKPLFGLRCTTRWQTIGLDQGPEVGDDMVLIIDENKQRVLKANKASIPGEHRITEDGIEVKTKTDTTTFEFSINRVTGALKGKSLVVRGGVILSGRCDKSEAGVRKF